MTLEAHQAATIHLQHDGQAGRYASPARIYWIMARTKYRNRKTVIDGITFASKREARRYAELRLFEALGRISELELQPRYTFPVRFDNGRRAAYVADFRYKDCDTNELVVEDVKGVRTAVYKLKKAMMRHFYDIEISEI